MAKKTYNVRIDQKTIFLIIGLLLTLKFLQVVSTVLITLFVAYLFSVAIYPFVDYLKKYKIPRTLSSATILLSILIIFLTGIGSMIPPVVEQTASFIHRLPEIIDQLSGYNIDVSAFSGQFANLSSNIFQLAINTFSGVIFLTTILVIAYYLIKEREHLESTLKLFLGNEQADHLEKTIKDIEVKLGHWVRGEIMLMLIVGTLNYIGFVLIGLDYALPLAIIAGLLELIPNLGPTVATIPAAIVGFAMSPIHGLVVIGISTIVQQLENNFIVPQIMKKTIGLHPVVTIVALLVGFKLGGFMLAVLALPIVLTIQAILKHYFSHEFPKDSPIINNEMV